jgi:hypothetical protein
VESESIEPTLWVLESREGVVPCEWFVVRRIVIAFETCVYEGTFRFRKKLGGSRIIVDDKV